MRLLLDTHVFLWALADDPRLTAPARSLLENPEAELVVSAATLWEISIKSSLVRHAMPITAQQAHGYLQQAGYTLLPILPRHILRVETLPPHHQDPFDRLLVAQALEEPLRLVTHERKLLAYSDSLVVWV